MSVHGAFAAGGEAVRFLSFCLDRRGGRLTRAGRVVQLRPKTWAVLLYLVDHPGVLVTKEDLLDAVWPDVAVTPDTLTKSIGELRVALADDSRSPRCIETVHRRGFRFIAPLTVEPSGLDAGTRLLGADLSPPDAALKIPFVGRTAERAQLAALLAKARASQRQIAFVTGPTGIGKTTLIEAFLDSPAVRDAALPVWIGRGSCIDQHVSREAFLCVLEALDRLVRCYDDGRALALLRRAAPTWLVQMPWLVDAGDALQTPLQAARAPRMLREFTAFTEGLTKDVTLILVLEDLHWGDSSTADLFSVLAQRREPARLLIIGTYRPAEVAVQEHALSQVVQTLRLHRQCVELPVHELTRDDVQSYLAARFPGAAFSASLACVLHDHTDGNPLFMVAVVDHMLSRGLILETAPGWALSAPLDKINLGVPDDVRHMVETQLEVLNPSDRELLEVMSVGGMELAVQAIAGALGLDCGAVERQCETLARAHRFLRAAGSTEWPDRSVARRYAFIHELYRQVVYAAIPEGQRQNLHRRLGDTLEAAYGDRATELAAVLAMHFERSGDYTRALRYRGAAAVQARRRFANREAIGHLEAALALAAQLPEQRARQRCELELRLTLGAALNDLYGFASEPVRENWERAYALCDQGGSPEQRFLVLYALTHLHTVRADKVLVPALVAELDELARRLGTAEHHLLADSALVRVAAATGRFTEACRFAEQRLPALRPEEVSVAPPIYGADPLIAAHCHYAFALWMLGHTDRAATIMHASRVAAQGRGSAFGLASALWFSCLLEVLCRNPIAARELAEQAVALCAEHGLAYWSAMAAALRGYVCVQEGQLGAGIAEIEGARAASAAMGARLFSAPMLAFLAEAHLRRGDVAAGLAAAEEGLTVAESTLDRTFWPELWRLKGELLLAAMVGAEPRRDRRVGRVLATAAGAGVTEAERCLWRALELARQNEAKALELRAATSLSRAWLRQGRIAEAHALLRDLCQWFDPGARGADLTDARTLLAASAANDVRRTRVTKAARLRVASGDHFSPA